MSTSSVLSHTARELLLYLIRTENLRVAALVAGTLTRLRGSATIEEILVGVLDKLGRPSEALKHAEHAASHRVDRLGKKWSNPADIPSLSPEQRIVASGYFYSGSGALVDFLCGFRGTLKWMPVGETRIIKSPGGIASFEKQFFAGRRDAALLDLYLTIVGRKISHDHTWKTSNAGTRGLVEHAEDRGYQYELLKFWRSLGSEVTSSTSDYRSRSRLALAMALDAAAKGHRAKRIVLDQAVSAWRMHLSDFLPPSTFLVVDRDPRDHFVEYRAGWAKMGKTVSVEQYVSTYVAIREKARATQAAKAKSRGHRFLNYQFEDFVYEFATSSQLLQEQLGIEGSSKSYNPEKSKRNIGKHHHALAKQERDLIESNLRQFLDPRADYAPVELSIAAVT